MNNPWERLQRLAESLTTENGLAERQCRWLMACLRRNSDTEYGKHHDFATISDPKNYQQRVPLTNYESIHPYIDRIMQGEPDVLFSGRAITFETTGGSSSGEKMVPYSEQSIRDFRQAILPWIADVARHYEIDTGLAYFSISPACRVRQTLASGIPLGMTDGAYLGLDVLELLNAITVTPSWIGELTDVKEWRFATLYHLVGHSDLKLISVWSPTFFLSLLDALDTHIPSLIQIYRNGGQIAGYSLEPDSEAAKRLTAYSEQGQTRLLWPQLRLVSCWSDGSSKPFFDQLRNRLPDVAFQRKGLLSTESVVTVPTPEGNCLLAADSGFYEFLDENGIAHLPHRLLEGQKYEVVITTSGGLYRYRSGDVVRFDGYIGGLPAFSFMGRRGLSSDLVGEKLTDEFVCECLEELAGFRMLVPTSRPAPRYRLVLDSSIGKNADQVAAKVEERLSQNPQYAYARQIGQLHKLSPLILSQPIETYTDLAHRDGKRLGDIKLPALSGNNNWNRFIESLT